MLQDFGAPCQQQWNQQHSHLEPEVQVVPERHLEVAGDHPLAAQQAREQAGGAHKHLTGALLLAAAHTVVRLSAGLADGAQQAPDGSFCSDIHRPTCLSGQLHCMLACSAVDAAL